MSRENSGQHEQHEERIIRQLYEAAYEGSASAFDCLLQQDRHILHKINPRTTSIKTPLHISASLGHLDLTKALLSHKPHNKFALESDLFGNTALHIASAEGHILIVKALLEDCEEACLVSDKDGRIPLHVAVIRGRRDVVKELIKYKKRESLRIPHEGKTVLHLCVTHNRLDILKDLVDSGIGTSDDLLDLRDSDDNTIFHSAILLKQPETVRYLASIPRIRAASNLNEDMGIVRRIPKDEKILEIQVILMGAGFKIPGALIVREARKKGWWNMVKRMGQLFTHNGDWLEEMRGNLSIVATFIATITFQALINPPGSFIQQGISKPADSSDKSTTSSDDSIGPFGCVISRGYLACPGSSLLAVNDSSNFRQFITFNTTAFIASLGVALLLVSGVPLKNKVVMWMLCVGMMITLTALVLTYVSAFLMITALPLGGSDEKVSNIALWTWVGLLVIVGIYIFVAFVIWLVKKCVKICKRIGFGCQCVRCADMEDPVAD